MRDSEGARGPTQAILGTQKPKIHGTILLRKNVKPPKKLLHKHIVVKNYNLVKNNVFNHVLVRNKAFNPHVEQT